MPELVFGVRVRRATGSTLLSLAFAALAAAGCGDAAQSPLEPPASLASLDVATAAPLPALLEEPVVLDVPTYEGSNESVHPDVVEFPNGWNGYRYWLTMTPYPKSDFHVENPSMLGSHDGVTLETPVGLKNPVIAAPGGKNYNSDPELLYEQDTGRLLLFYRFVDRKANTIRVSSSLDGRTWKPESKAFWARTHNAVSPTVTPRTATAPARIWYVSTGAKGCKAPSTKVMMRSALDTTGRLARTTWSEPVATDLAQPGYVIWHMKVRYVPSKGEYWAIYAAYPAGPAGCDVDDLFLARSTDGMHWTTFAQPLLRHEDRAWTAAALYRSSFLYDAISDELRVWISARGNDQKWRLGLARFSYSRLVPELSATTAARLSTARFPVLPAFGANEDTN